MSAVKGDQSVVIDGEPDHDNASIPLIFSGLRITGMACSHASLFKNCWLGERCGLTFVKRFYA